jgi:hypothetical protein
MEKRSLLRCVRDAGIGEGRVVEDKLGCCLARRESAQPGLAMGMNFKRKCILFA